MRKTRGKCYIHIKYLTKLGISDLPIEGIMDALIKRLKVKGKEDGSGQVIG